MAETLATMHDKMESFLNRTDITDETKTILLNMAMHDVERGQFVFGGTPIHWNFQCMQKRQTTTSDEMYITYPDSIKELKWIKAYWGDRYWDLEIKDPGVALSLWPFDSDITGPPKMASIIPAQGEIMIRPTPDTTYTFDVCYYAFTTDLADDADTNWWLTNAYEVILFGGLYFTKAYLPDDSRVAMWKQMYDEQVFKLIQEEQQEEVGGGFMRIEPYLPKQLSGKTGFDIDVINY